MPAPILSVKDLKKDYYQYQVFFRGKLLTRALRGISFTVTPGEFVGLIGVNGAGKSTLMRILTTNMQKSSGKVMLNNYDLDKDEESIKEKISWMFGQDYSGIGWASVEKNMHLAAAMLGLEKKEAAKRISFLIKKFQLESKRHIDVWRLSTGMAAKYSLAVALLKRPSFLFLDEPLLGLDTYAKDEIRGILKELNEQGTTILYTDHQLHEVEKICKRLLIINEGKLVFDGSVKKLKQKYRDTNVIDIICTGKDINAVMHNLLQKRFFDDYDLLDSDGETHTLKLFTRQDAKRFVVPLFQELRRHRITVDQMNTGLLSLEDVYRKFLRVDKHYSKTKHLEYFGKTGEKPLQHFEKLLSNKNPKVRARACKIFWKRNKQKVKPILLDMLTGNKEMQQEALHVIGQIKDKHFTSAVLKLLEEREVLTKNYAVVALAKLGDDSILNELIQLLLHHETCSFVLEHVLEFDPLILEKLQEKIVKLSGYDKAFLRHYCLALKKHNFLLEALHLQKISVKRRM